MHAPHLSSPLAPFADFKQQCCARLDVASGCDLDTVLRRTLYPHARCLRWILLRVNSRVRSIRLGVSAGGILLLGFLSACQSSGGPAIHRQAAYGVFTELGKSQVAMQPGANIRRFNTINAHGGGHISYDEATGILTLAPGTYRVSGYSITTFGYDLTPEQQKLVRSVPGYAFFWNVDTNSIAILGSMQDPMYSLTSHVDDIVTVARPTRFFLGHQNGTDVTGVLLDSYDAAATTSTNHVFARLVVERIEQP